jgi:hypothetical protein
LPKETCAPALIVPAFGNSAAPANALNALAIKSDAISGFFLFMFFIRIVPLVSLNVIKKTRRKRLPSKLGRY